MLNQCVKYLGQGSFHSKIRPIDRTRGGSVAEWLLLVCWTQVQ